MNYPEVYKGGVLGGQSQSCPEIELRGVLAEIKQLDVSLSNAQQAASFLREKLGPILPQLPQATCKESQQPKGHGHSQLCRTIQELYMRVDDMGRGLNALIEEVEI